MTLSPGSQSLLLDEFVGKHELYEEFKFAIEYTVRDLATELGIGVDITSRVKDSASLAAKLRKKSHYSTLFDIPDLVGVRVIAQTLLDVAAMSTAIEGELSLREKVVHGSPDSEQMFDYAGHHLIVEFPPPPRGLLNRDEFQGLRCEIQVRTIMQHAWASISHSLLYKSEDDVPTELKRTLSQVAALIEVGDDLFKRFRDEVEKLRAGYTEQAQVADESWRTVAINLESVFEFWNKWKPVRLVGYPFTQLPGVRVVDRPHVSDSAYPDPDFLSNLTSEANRLKISTLGQLADVTASDEYRDRVFELVRSTTPESGQATFPLDFLVGTGSYYGHSLIEQQEAE